MKAARRDFSQQQTQTNTQLSRFKPQLYVRNSLISYRKKDNTGKVDALASVGQEVKRLPAVEMKVFVAMSVISFFFFTPLCLASGSTNAKHIPELLRRLPSALHNVCMEVASDRQRRFVPSPVYQSK